MEQRLLQPNEPPSEPPRKRRRLRRILLGVAAVVLGIVTWAAVFVDRYGRAERARPADAIVVLGAMVRPGGVPSDSLRERTLHAVELYRQGYARSILTTGGVGKNPPAEARVAADLALSRGVPASALVLEDCSTSTETNALYAARLCRERGWTRVVVVSDPYHLYRAGRCFERAGLVPYVSPAHAAMRNRTILARAFWTLREVVLLGRDLVKYGGL